MLAKSPIRDFCQKNLMRDASSENPQLGIAVEKAQKLSEMFKKRRFNPQLGIFATAIPNSDWRPRKTLLNKGLH